MAFPLERIGYSNLKEWTKKHKLKLNGRQCHKFLRINAHFITSIHETALHHYGTTYKILEQKRVPHN
ncbi:hypothetical protein Bhyg_03947 [Pseudolycoriella hygida]|uniref:Uncharacterized protein n=1 Tax=Pseudolycoriella hygida TaxID=35572 RepID=A0A9Q0NE83_9DIPT|nr:hypothetical protein Bhyg_03947 [Pseudolycoriella hygida]